MIIIDRFQISVYLVEPITPAQTTISTKPILYQSILVPTHQKHKTLIWSGLAGQLWSIWLSKFSPYVEQPSLCLWWIGGVLPPGPAYISTRFFNSNVLLFIVYLSYGHFDQLQHMLIGINMP